ncbi:GNAT family N-acetyltransferase [Solicola gregarius]|uniref:GNAT family N-acetyltransferase n=1 Tax=Solicola gregarius TaxID=2908642 RepID=A0AA46TH76_9ACTN|nr:GNAT family N-acetyltransferase [Solicola gregarius]UYM05304.1 GNAT family N-acetyltransferase [Solicola gregarius]
MSRVSIVVRDAEIEDAAALIEVWDQCNAVDIESYDSETASGIHRKPMVAEAADALSEQLSDPDRKILVAVRDGDVVGAIAFRRQLLSLIQTEKVIVVTDLHVAPRHRRRLIASSLISAGVRWAEDVNCEVMMAVSPADSRDANRFLNRIGFGQVAVVRAAQVSALGSRFAGIATSSRFTGRLIALRRTMRRRQSHVRPGSSV